jgi:hypothetical protein
MGDHIGIEGFIEERTLRDCPTEASDVKNAAMSLTLKLRGEIEHKCVVCLHESILQPQR